MKNMERKISQKKAYKMISNIEKMLIQAESAVDNYEIKKAKIKLDYVSNLNVADIVSSSISKSSKTIGVSFFIILSISIAIFLISQCALG